MRKAGAYPSGAHLRPSTPGWASGLTRKYKTGLEKLAKDKYTSLFGLAVSDEEKRFYIIDTWSQVYKTFFVTDSLVVYGIYLQPSD